jgi:hypothetical protein
MIRIVVEGESDETLLRRLLEPLNVRRPVFDILVGGGRSSADSLARTILAVRRQPVALVLDADTNNESMVSERYQFYNESLGQVAASSMFRVFLMVPELEVIFFQSPDIIRSITGVKISREQVIRGRYEPKAVLKDAVDRGGKPWSVASLSEPVLRQLREVPPIKQLADFIVEQTDLAAAA